MPYSVMHRQATVALALCALVNGCAASKSVSEAGTPPAATRSGPRNVLAEEELAQSSARDAYHAVQLLRSDWLRTRGAASVRDPAPTEVVVYVNGQRHGGPRALEQFRISEVKEMRYYTPTEATNRWGTGHSGGVISLTTR